MNMEYDNSGRSDQEPYRENENNSEQGAYRMSGSQIPDSRPETSGTLNGDQNPYANQRYSTEQNHYTNQQSGTSQNFYANQSYGAGQNSSGNQNSNASQNPYTGRYSGYGYSRQAGSSNANPMAGYNVRKTEPKKKSGSRRVVALAVACALIGGLGIGAAAGMALRGGSAAVPAAVEESMAEPQAPEETAAIPEVKAEAEASEDNTNINTTVIEVTTNSQTTSMTPQDVYEQYVNAVVAISNEGTTTNVFGQMSETASSGSGFIISQDGYIITNNHVVSGAETLTVTMTNGEAFEAEIIGADAENDVALIKIDASGLPTVAIGESGSIEVGQQVCAIGNPLGELTNTLTVGYVSALDREINENGTPINMFQTDCAINSGNSGGPIFDMHGNVIGITTAKYSSNGTYQASIEGIGFCVPIDDAMDIVSDLLEYGYVKGRASLGISCQAISSTVTQYYHLPAGVYVYAVMEGSAADNAGVKEGDIITAIDGTEITSITELKSRLKEYSAGDTAILSVYRSDENGAETLELPLTFDEKQ